MLPRERGFPSGYWYEIGIPNHAHGDRVRVRAGVGTGSVCVQSSIFGLSFRSKLKLELLN